jgi:Mlc titration factor MtfA (ptsG expression regulator)
MLFSWLRERRRRQLLAEPFPPAWLGPLEKNVAHYAVLSDAEKAKLRDTLRILIAEKNWEGCRGLVITDEMKVTVGALASLLLLGIEHDYFHTVQTVLVYPSSFRRPADDRVEGDLVPERGEELLGEAWYRGPVVLSWPDSLEAAQFPGAYPNTVLHEFAHQLDYTNGLIDGTPQLESDAQRAQWREVMTAEYERLIRRSEEGRPTLLDPYGATNEGEFFAVATESFFDQPVEMAQMRPRLYGVLRDYYRQDPAERARRHEHSP